ncbi:hypothetical protein AAFP30_08270 [Gordonia sp. CPCC 205515]|uniref:hypothetical protein n=1 Tax=Gordonia sp. CPCC 205515 TaxID=3140791 RepID=UPI003AF3BEEB
MTHATAPDCVWCSSTDDIANLGGESRCGRCRTLEHAIAEAREFVRFYGLRPIGGSVESEDDEERDHRVAAREAYAELTRTRTHTPPRRASRSGHRATKAGSTPTAGKAGGAGTTKAEMVMSGTTSRPTVSRPDHAELMSRAEGLLAQLADIDERLAVAEQDSGLSRKAKVADLTAKRDVVLRTLAALEKAKRSLEPA